MLDEPAATNFKRTRASNINVRLVVGRFRAFQIEPRACTDSYRSPTNNENSTRQSRQLPSVQHVGLPSIVSCSLTRNLQKTATISSHIPPCSFSRRCRPVCRGCEQKVLAQLALKARLGDTLTRERGATLVGDDRAPIRLRTAGELAQSV